MKPFKKERPVFPKKAIVTSGMPYGNKDLHFGHVGGLFVHADTFARFLRDRIGHENVIFVSGTDCYGSPALEGYRQLCESGFSGSIEDYVGENHELQKKTLSDYLIKPNLFAASGMGIAKEWHNEVSKDFFEKLYKNGSLVKESTPQFYDTEREVFLNGRQVVGKCPFEGCASEKAYADECGLGHQYNPEELIDPKSTLTGKTPELRDVTNWYFKLDSYLELMTEAVDAWKKGGVHRKHMIRSIEEFLKSPVIYVQKTQVEDLEALCKDLPQHELINEEKKPSYTFIFKNLTDRDTARELLTNKEIRFRTGKTLVPFRLSGDCEWGVPVPNCEGLDNLTFWVWPESLWAPISFTKAYLNSVGRDVQEWESFWKDKDSKVYQFIGEDNIYFYGIAEMGMFVSFYADEKEDAYKLEGVNLPHIVDNKHILFMNKKASSSSDIKPPMASELLDHYTAEQLRIHFLSLGLANKNASFQPNVYLPENERESKDPVLKEGNLLTNVFNRLVRSCFYTTQTYFDSVIPQGEVDEKILSYCEEKAFEFERHMYNHDFHRLTYVLDEFIRFMNKHWVSNIKEAEKNEDNALRAQILTDCFYGVKVITTLLHSIAPQGSEMIKDYLGASDDLWNWDFILSPLSSVRNSEEKLKFLEPRVDFFSKHPSQFENN